MTGPGDEPLFFVGEAPPGEEETAAKYVEAANALVREAGGLLNPVELAAVARTRLEEYLRRDLLPGLVASPACRRGCAWCCNSSISASIAEAVAVAVYVLTTKTADERAAIGRRLDAYVREVSGLTPDERRGFRKPCPFLQGDACGVYPVRPMICAGFLSPTPEACERVAKDPGAATLTVRGGMDRAAFLCLVLSRMFGAFGLEAEPVDFAAAVKIILDDPTSVDRWREGERVFSAIFIGRIMAGSAPSKEVETRRFERALPALLEELERRAGPGAAAATREAWEKWRQEGTRRGTPLPTLMPRS